MVCGVLRKCRQLAAGKMRPPRWLRQLPCCRAAAQKPPVSLPLLLSLALTHTYTFTHIHAYNMCTPILPLCPPWSLRVSRCYPHPHAGWRAPALLGWQPRRHLAAPVMRPLPAPLAGAHAWHSVRVVPRRLCGWRARMALANAVGLLLLLPRCSWCLRWPAGCVPRGSIDSTLCKEGASGRVGHICCQQTGRAQVRACNCMHMCGDACGQGMHLKPR